MEMEISEIALRLLVWAMILLMYWEAKASSSNSQSRRTDA